jgi:hypothetical protein
MPSRFEYERAIRSSELPPLSRLLALTIASWADVRDGIIPERLMPSLTALEDATGMARASVRTHLNHLEGGGWLKRDRPTALAARTEKARTQYTLRIPKGAEVPDSDGIELGQEMTGTGAGTAPVDPSLGQELPQAGAGDALELGQEMTRARAGAAPSSSFGPHTSAEYQQAGESADPAYGIPAEARPLVDALSLAGVRVRWPFKGNQWFPVLALVQKAGIPAMTELAAKAAARTPVESAKYFIKAWAELPPLPDATAGRPQLSVVPGGWQPYANPADPSVYENGF